MQRTQFKAWVAQLYDKHITTPGRPAIDLHAGWTVLWDADLQFAGQFSEPQQLLMKQRGFMWCLEDIFGSAWRKEHTKSWQEFGIAVAARKGVGPELANQHVHYFRTLEDAVGYALAWSPALGNSENWRGSAEDYYNTKFGPNDSSWHWSAEFNFDPPKPWTPESETE